MGTDDSDAAKVRNAAAALYGNGQQIWDRRDAWNRIKRDSIDRFAEKAVAPLDLERKWVLDVGAGKDGYAWLPDSAIRLDRFAEQVERYRLAVAGELEQLPFPDAAFDITICVGSVLNYASAMEGIAELSRVTKQGGWMLLHFETSNSLEHIFRERWRSQAASIQTINSSRPDRVWVYNPRYIARALTGFGFAIRRKSSFHILSALGLRIGLPQKAAAHLALLDPVARIFRLPSDDVILLAERTR